MWKGQCIAEAKSKEFAVHTPKVTGSTKVLPHEIAVPVASKCSLQASKCSLALWLENCNHHVHLNEKPPGKFESA